MHDSKLDPKKKERIEAMKKRRKSRAAALCSRLDNVIQLEQLGPGPEPPDQSGRRIKLKAYKVKKGKSFGDPLCCTPGSSAGSSSELSTKLDNLIEFSFKDRDRWKGLKRGALIGGGINASLSGLALARYGKGIGLAGAAFGGARGALVGGGIGALVGAKRKKELSAKLDQIIEFARGDYLMRALAKWSEKQPKALRGMLHGAMATGDPKERDFIHEGASAFLRRDVPKLSKVMGKKEAGQIMAINRSETARRVRGERTAGIHKTKFKNLRELIEAQGKAHSMYPPSPEQTKRIKDFTKDIDAGTFDRPGRRFSAKLDQILFDDRPRNQLGEFSGQQEGAPDPNSMAKVYGAGKRTGLLEGAGAALAGGGLGAVGASAGKSVSRHSGKIIKNLLSRAKKSGRIIVPK